VRILKPILATLFLTICSSVIQGQLCDYPVVIAELNTGIWAEEISWGIINDDGTQAVSAVTGYEDNSFYSIELCLAPGCYTVWMEDSYGDGWQGAVLTIVNLDGEILCSGLVDSSPGDEATMTLPLTDDCPIPGCTLAEAFNFSPSATEDDGSCVRKSDNVELYGYWNDDSLPITGFGGAYSDVEGLEVNGVEYAVLGSTLGAHILDISSSGEAIEVAFLEGAIGGSNVTHRDYHINGDILYAVCDQGSSTLQIFDLSDLPNSVTTLYDDNEFSITSHNVFVDNESELLYLCSNYSPTSSTAVRILDVHNPTQPFEFITLDPWISNCHDIYVENDTAWINSGGAGFFVMHIDATPTIIANLDDYPYQGGNHSGWWIPEDEIYVFADETHGSPLKVVDTSDLSDLQVVSTLSSNNDPEGIPHNLMIRDDLVFVSYYHDGLQVFDISDPTEPHRVAWYDTFIETSYAGYAGAWGVHSALPSGRILISDIVSGLHVLELTPEEIEICSSGVTIWNGVEIYSEGYYSQEVEDEYWGTDIVWATAVLNDDSCTECIGDVDGNGSIGVSDLQLTLAAFGCQTSCEIDFNSDGSTTVADLLFWLNLFGTNC